MRTLLRLTGACLFAFADPASAQVARLSMLGMTIAPGAREIVVGSANVPDDGLLVARVVRSRRINWTPIGQTRLRPGESANVPITLARAVRPGETVVVTLYADHGRKGVFDNDPPVLTVDLQVETPRGAGN